MGGTDEKRGTSSPLRQNEVRCVAPNLEAVLHLVQDSPGELVRGRVAAHVAGAHLAVCGERYVSFLR